MREISTVQILVGISGSGKSTYAKQMLFQPKWSRVNRDSFRLMLKNAQVCENKIEDIITVLQNKAIISLINKKQNVIIDNTNLKARYINELIELIKYKANIEFVVFEEAINVCIDRDSKREAKVGESVIKKQYKDFLELKKKFVFDSIPKHNPHKLILNKLKTFEKNNDLPNACIFDIDGTISLMSDRDPFDLARVGNDYVNKPVVEHMIMQRMLGREIIIVSGRDSGLDDMTYHKTVMWLKNNDIYYDHLIMRQYNDYRKDSIVKKEIYDNYIKDCYNIVTVYDDRQQVVDMWRSLGLTCFQVNESPD